MMLFTRRGGVGGGGIVAVCAYWACLESRGFGGVVDRGPARNAENERRTKKDWTRVWCCAPYSVAVYTRVREWRDDVVVRRLNVRQVHWPVRGGAEAVDDSCVAPLYARVRARLFVCLCACNVRKIIYKLYTRACVRVRLSAVLGADKVVVWNDEQYKILYYNLLDAFPESRTTLLL